MDTLEITARQTDIGWMALCDEFPMLCGLGDDAEQAVADLEEEIETFLRSRVLH